MKKKLFGLAAAAAMTALFSMTAFAGSWQKDNNGWWYQHSNGSWPANCWEWIDGNADGVSECYYFDQNGYCLLNTTTPDGYQVDQNGAWVVNGAVQTQSAGQPAIQQIANTMGVQQIELRTPLEGDYTTGRSTIPDYWLTPSINNTYIYLFFGGIDGVYSLYKRNANDSNQFDFQGEYWVDEDANGVDFTVDTKAESPIISGTLYYNADGSITVNRICNNYNNSGMYMTGVEVCHYIGNEW